MKKSEVYIENLGKKFKCLSAANIKLIYEKVNQLDWKIFCSYMADYDQPQERVAAEAEFQKFKNMYSPIVQRVFDEIREYMKNDPEYNIHKMDEEV